MSHLRQFNSVFFTFCVLLRMMRSVAFFVVAFGVSRLLPAFAQSERPPAPALSAASVAEESIFLQEIPSVYGASKYEQKVTEAPSSVTIITSEEIKKYGCRTLADVLQSVNGFYVTSDRNYGYVGVRGFGRPADYNTRVLLLVDGHRINDNVYDSATIGTEAPIDVDLIDRVEIIRGPSSSLYGTNAFFGVINIITKRGRDIKGWEISSEAGSFASYKGRLTYGNKFSNGIEFLFSSSFYDSHGHHRLFFKEFNDPATNNGIAHNGDDDQFPHFFGKLSFRDFTLQGSFISREKGIPTAPYGTVFNTTRTRSVDERAYVDLVYNTELANHLNLTAKLYYDRYAYRGDFLYQYPDKEGSSPVLNQDHQLGEWWGSELELSKRVFAKHLVTLGAEYRDNFRQDQRNADQEPFSLYFKDQRNSRLWALYLQDEFSILDNLILNAGIRYDYYDSFGGTTSPRLALIYNWHKTTAKLLYGEAFRAPTVYEQYYSGTGLKANPHLEPERISTYELIVEQYLGPHLRASLAGYYYTIHGLISQVSDPTDGLLVYTNAEDVEARGLELQLEGHWASDLEGRFGYALQEAEDQRRRKQLTNSPHHVLKWNLIYPLIPDKLFLGIEARYLSDRLTLTGKTTGSHFVTNLTLFGQQLINGVEVTASVFNLFDERYGDPGSTEHRQNVITQDGRTFWIKLKHSF